MSHQLWRYFLEDDVESFQRALTTAKTKQNPKASTVVRGGQSAGSPVAGKALAGSPVQSRKSSGNVGKSKLAQAGALTKSEVNLKDYQGLSLLHWIASTRNQHAWEYAQALLELPVLDLSLPDAENAWTALHRALYFGNVTIARAILNRDTTDVRLQSNVSADALFKIKDREGNSPFDLFNASVAPRSLQIDVQETRNNADLADRDDESHHEDSLERTTGVGRSTPFGDDLYVFGSNKNLNLGVGDQDDRQFPERISLRRPDHLAQRLRLEHISKSVSRKSRLLGNDGLSESVDLSGDCPALVEFKSMRICDVQLAKLHTAVITDDPEANLYMCGFGSGGRLGTGDESTRFSFTCVYGGALQGQRVESVALGQDHTLAITQSGEVFSWGSNRFGQLGYSVSASKDEEPTQKVPRQIFGSLKREKVLGCAASRIHSVVYTANNLYTFGKNEGQLGLVDSDARSLDMQVTPRAVAASLFQEPIVQITAIDKATACILKNTDVWVFANYGYTRVKFPLDDFSNYFLQSTYSTARFDNDGPNHTRKLASGGDTIAALSSEGQVFSFNVSQSIEPAGRASTTNPVKIKNALSEPKRVWSPRKNAMACADVDVGQDGSIVICTRAGSVWRRIKRSKAKDTSLSASQAGKLKDFKFSRIPGLTWISSVRCNAFGSFAAIRHDWDVMHTQINAPPQMLWQDFFELYPFKNLSGVQDSNNLEIETHELLDSLEVNIMKIRRAVLNAQNLEDVIKKTLESLDADEFDVFVATTIADIRIPCHEFLLSGRSRVMTNGLATLREAYFFNVPDVLTIGYDKTGKPLVSFQAVDILTLFIIVFYLYTDSLVDVWHYTRHSPAMIVRYKQVRLEVMRCAAGLGLKELERAARLQIEPKAQLGRDMEQAYVAPGYFNHADIEILLKDTTYYGHRALLVQRCPFFEGMFAGLSGGSWSTSQYKTSTEDKDLHTVDLTHVSPETFDLVLRHLYADTGPELFDDVPATDLDNFLDICMDVMAVANEIMLDSLSQVCQLVLGRFVTPRNVCGLLNAVAPCSVTTFKSAALEYICLNLELMLETHLLDELDDDLMLELDEVVRENQGAYFGFTHRGDYVDEKMLNTYPDLAERLEFSRRRKVSTMASRARRLQRNEEERTARAPKSPRLVGKTSSHDLLFDMDEDGGRIQLTRPVTENASRSPRIAAYTSAGTPTDESPWLDRHGRTVHSDGHDTAPGSLSDATTPRASAKFLAVDPITPRNAAAPWGSMPLSERLDIKEIMSQTDDRRHSNISAGLSAQPNSKSSPSTFKMSQKERKRQMLERQKRESELARQELSNAARKEPPRAWQAVLPKQKVKSMGSSTKQIKSTEAIGNVFSSQQDQVPVLQAKMRNSERTLSAGQASPMTSAKTPLQQRTVSSPNVSRTVIPVAGASTKVTTRRRSPSPKPKPDALRPRTVPSANSFSPAAPRSMRYAPSPSEPSLQLSMADILSQQQTEKQAVKEARAKKSLQEIQQEQEFMEWWDAEEKATKARLQADERAAKAAISLGEGRSGGSSRSSRGRGRGGRAEGGRTKSSQADERPSKSKPSKEKVLGGGGHKGGPSKGSSTGKS